MAHERSGVLLIRIWMEDHDPSTLRARIIQRTEVQAPHETVVIAADTDAIDAAVSQWVRRFVRDAAADPPSAL